MSHVLLLGNSLAEEPGENSLWPKVRLKILVSALAEFMNFLSWKLINLIKPDTSTDTSIRKNVASVF